MVVKGDCFPYHWSYKQVGKSGWLWALSASGRWQETVLSVYCAALFKIGMNFGGRGEREKVLGLLSLIRSHCSLLGSSRLTCAGHGVCRNSRFWAVCQEFRADKTEVVMVKWEKSNQKSSWNSVFLIYESTCDKELLSSKVAPEHAESMELGDESCRALPCLRCCSLRGAAYDSFVLMRNSAVLARRGEKKIYCGSSRGTNGNTKEELVTVNEKLQQGYIDQYHMMKDSVNEYFNLERVKAEKKPSLDIKTSTWMFQWEGKWESGWDLHHYSLVILKNWKMMKGNLTKNAKMHCCLRCKIARNFLQTLEI